jgi:hypothetical protein
MSLAWSVSGALIAWSAATGWGAQRARAAAVVAAAIFSHWVLDALVHVPGLPLLGAGSAKIGLGLWSNVPVALTLEGAITLCGLGLFLWGSGLRGRPAVTLCAIVLAALAMTIFGMLASEPPPDVRMQALASIIVMLAVAWMVGRMVRPSAIGESPDPDGEQEHERA